QVRISWCGRSVFQFRLAVVLGFAGAAEAGVVAAAGVAAISEVEAGTVAGFAADAVAEPVAAIGGLDGGVSIDTRFGATVSPGRTRCRPLTTMRSPGCKPLVTTRSLPWLAPNETCRYAVRPWSSTTRTKRLS